MMKWDVVMMMMMMMMEKMIIVMLMMIMIVDMAHANAYSISIRGNGCPSLDSILTISDGQPWT